MSKTETAALQPEVLYGLVLHRVQHLTSAPYHVCPAYMFYKYCREFWVGVRLYVDPLNRKIHVMSFLTQGTGQKKKKKTVSMIAVLNVSHDHATTSLVKDIHPPPREPPPPPPRPMSSDT